MKGALAAAGLMAGCKSGEPPDPFARPPFGEKELLSACGQCPAACGIRVRVVEGRVVKIEGLGGGIGPRGLSGPQVLYDPDRVGGPLSRRGVKGGPLVAIGWDEALSEVASRLGRLRDAGEPHRAVVALGQTRGTVSDLWRRFARAYGTPNLFLDSSPLAAAVGFMQGAFDTPGYDWSRARTILSLGSGMLDGSSQEMPFHRTRARRSRIVHAGSSPSRTAGIADEWIRIRPGTEGAFALGLSSVLVAEGLHDREFVETRSSGFERFQEILERASPERMARIVGASAGTFERLARELAAGRPAFAFAGEDAFLHPGGLHAAMAVHALNALLGSIDRPGGVLSQRDVPFAPWPEHELDERARAGLARPRLDGAGSGRFPAADSVFEALPEAVLAGDPYDADTLILHYRNPAYSRVEPERWRRALAKIPFVVTTSPFLDETTAGYADLVLPDHTYLERLEDAVPAPATGFPVLGIRQPAVRPLHDTRATGDVVLELARRLGGPVAGAFPWPDHAHALEERLAGVVPLRELMARGRWAGPAHAHGTSEKFEFHATGLAKRVEEAARARGLEAGELLESWGYPGGLDLVSLPHHREIAWHGDPERYALLLLPYRPHTYAEGSGANLPWLSSLAGTETEAELHPAAAEAAGIAEGDRIVVESPAGRIEALAHLDERAAPGAVRIALGAGHTAFGRFASGRGANVLELVSASGLDPLSGTIPVLGTRVSVRRVEA